MMSVALLFLVAGCAKPGPKKPSVQTVMHIYHCNRGSTVGCFEAGWAIQKSGTKEDRMLARKYFLKACNGSAIPHTSSMRAKNLGCKYYKLLNY